MTSPSLEWCIVRFGKDKNWWVTEISDEIHWDVDGLSILDPKQISHIIDLCEALRDYGFDSDVLDTAFYKFRIDREVKGRQVRLIRLNDSLFDTEEQLFALPDVMDDEKGPYADLLEQVTKCRVKLLNDLIEFEEAFTIDELEEEIREKQNEEYMEGRAIHVFDELTSILEYVPDGFEVDIDDDVAVSKSKEEEIADFEEIIEEKIEEDETMKWEEDEELEEKEELPEEEEDEIEEEEEKPKRGRPRKN